MALKMALGEAQSLGYDEARCQIMNNQHETSHLISGQEDQPQSAEHKLENLSEQLALPLTESERAASSKQLRAMHRGNRFRLMFGQAPLSEG